MTTKKEDERKPDFEDFLHEYYCENNPEVLDDMLPDATADWIADLDCEEFIRLGNIYARKYSDTRARLRRSRHDQ